MTRTLFIVAAFLPMFVCAGPVSASMAPPPPPPDLLTDDQPAEKWVEAFPTGNGELGAMVFGGVVDERIQLNIDSLWSGGPQDADNPEALEALPKVRQLLWEGKYNEAERLARRKLVCKGAGSGRGNGANEQYGSYQTLGDLLFTFQHSGEARNYNRSLAANGTVRTSYEINGATFSREIIPLNGARGMFIGLVSQGAPLQFRVRLERGGGFVATPWKNDGVRAPADGSSTPSVPGYCRASGGLAISGRLSGNPGMLFETVVYIEADSVSCDNGELTIYAADHACIFVTAATDWRGEDPHAECNARVADFQLRGFNTQPDPLPAMLETELYLGASSTEPTRMQLERIKKGEAVPALDAALFQFGRHLLASSSRPGDLPANLQGVWCDHIQAPWNCDYHHNINSQMNYWPAEVTNLAETALPFIEYIQSLEGPGARTARIHYGADGWVTHMLGNVWGYTSPGEDPGWGLFPMAGAWMCTHLWEHYAFEPSPGYLARVYPTMRRAAEFYLDYLVEDPVHQWLVTGPSNSPENRFKAPNGEVAGLCMGPTMDAQILREFFGQVVAASEALGIDEEFRAQVAAARERLVPTRIGKNGTIMEWIEDFEETEPGHRHMSHLFALHPGTQITPDGTPELADAARKTLAPRLENGGGHTGWSRAWLINFYARLWDGEEAYKHLQALEQKSLHPNLLGDHPPFQIDGNFGATAGIAEMLLQSHAGYVHLLPALPKAWPQGHFAKFRARGGWLVSVNWHNGLPNQAVLEARGARGNGPLRVRIPEGVSLVSARAGVPSVTCVLIEEAVREIQPTVLPGGLLEFPAEEAALTLSFAPKEPAS